MNLEPTKSEKMNSDGLLVRPKASDGVKEPIVRRPRSINDSTTVERYDGTKRQSIPRPKSVTFVEAGKKSTIPVDVPKDFFGLSEQVYRSSTEVHSVQRPLSAERHTMGTENSTGDSKKTSTQSKGVRRPTSVQLQPLNKIPGAQGRAVQKPSSFPMPATLSKSSGGDSFTDLSSSDIDDAFAPSDEFEFRKSTPPRSPAPPVPPPTPSMAASLASFSNFDAVESGDGTENKPEETSEQDDFDEDTTVMSTEDISSLNDLVSEKSTPKIDANIPEEEQEDVEDDGDYEYVEVPHKKQTTAEQLHDFQHQLEESEKRKGSVLPMIAIFVILLIIAGVGVYMIRQAPDEVKPTEQELKALAEANEAPVVWEPLKTFNVDIKGQPSSAVLFVNGIRTDVSDAKVIADQKNILTVYAKGYMPKSVVLDKDYDYAKAVDMTMEHDVLFEKANIEIKPNAADADSVSLEFDGIPLHGEFKVKDVPLGVPHVIVAKAPGKAGMLAVIWPMKSTGEDFFLPAMVDEKIGARLTKVIIKLAAVAKGASVVLDIGEETFRNPGEYDAAKGTFVKLKSAMKQRFDLEYAVDPSTFGLVYIAPNLKVSSLGEAQIIIANEFGKGKKKVKTDARVCFSRPDHLVCPEMNALVSVPSGSWKVIAYKGEGENAEMLPGTFTMNLYKDKKYQHALVVQSNGIFTLPETAPSEKINVEEKK